MKKVFILFWIALMPVALCYAQKDSLSLSEQNKYTYYKVNDALPNINAEALAAYLKKNIPGLQSVQTANAGNTVSGKGGVLVYKKGLVTGQEEGRIDYKLMVDFNESKYRLVITDFELVPYQRNRYGVFAPVDGVSFPLEKKNVRITEKQLAYYLNRMGATGINTNRIVNDFVNKKTSVKKASEPLKRVDTQKW